MPRIRVKVCGITNQEDAQLAVRCGADALGFIFAESPRRVDVPTARRIISHLPPFVARVGVFRNQPLSWVMEIMNDIGLTHAQLHGSESQEYTRQLGQRGIKVFSLTGPEILRDIKLFRLDTFMLDIPKDHSSTILDYVEIAKLAAGEGHLILAGRLTPENVKDVIMAVRPFAVDVASGVEAYPGKKSQAKLERFFEQVREAEHDLPPAG